MTSNKNVSFVLNNLQKKLVRTLKMKPTQPCLGCCSIFNVSECENTTHFPYYLPAKCRMICKIWKEHSDDKYERLQLVNNHNIKTEQTM